MLKLTQQKAAHPSLGRARRDLVVHHVLPLLLVQVLAIDIEDFVGWAEVRRIERQITFEL